MNTALLRMASIGPLGERLWLIGDRTGLHAKVCRRQPSTLPPRSAPWTVTLFDGQRHVAIYGGGRVPHTSGNWNGRSSFLIAASHVVAQP